MIFTTYSINKNQRYFKKRLFIAWKITLLAVVGCCSVNMFAAPPMPAKGKKADAPSAKFSGVIVDDSDAEFIGEWVRASKDLAIVGKSYSHDTAKSHDTDKTKVPSEMSVRFTPDLTAAGPYEVRLIYPAHQNRASNVAVTVNSADGEKSCTVNQKQEALISGVARSLGVFKFEAGKKGSVVVSNAGAKGIVAVDAVQFVPLAVAQAERAALPQAPSAPKDVRQTQVSPAHIRVEWIDSAENESGYRIMRREPGREWYLAGETGPNATHFDDGGMQQDTTYEHSVAAFNEGGESTPAETAKPLSTAHMIEHIQTRKIIQEGITTPEAPSAIALKDGSILLVYHPQKPKDKKSSNQNSDPDSLCAMVSLDEGTTWSEPRMIIKSEKGAYAKPAFVRMPDGRLGMSFTWIDLGENAKMGKDIRRERQFMYSADEGATWSKPVVIVEASSNNDTLIVGDKGRLLQALSFYTPAAWIFASDDLGATWSKLADVATYKAAQPTGEAALVHVEGAKLVFISRQEAPFYCVRASADNGQTWDEPRSIYCGGGDNPPKLARLPGSNVIVAVIHSWYKGVKAKDRRQLASVISRDGGKTWDNFRLIGFSPEGKDGFLQHSLTFVGDLAYIFHGGGSSKDTNDGHDLYMLRLHKDFFTSTTPWPYDWQGKPLNRENVKAGKP